MRLIGFDLRPRQHGHAEIFRLLRKPPAFAEEIPRALECPFAHRLPPTAMDYSSFSYNRRVFVYCGLAAGRANRYEMRQIARANVIKMPLSERHVRPKDLIRGATAD